MSDEDHRAAGRLELLQRRQQGGLAVGIEAGVGLVQNDERRHAVERTREADALTLASRQALAAIADLGIVAVRHRLDHGVHAGHLRRGDDVSVAVPAKAGDVLGNRAREKLDVLRQITDVAPQLLGVPMADLGAIETHGAHQDGPHADHGARQSGLARGAGADHADGGAGRHGERHALDHRPARARRSDGDVLHGQFAGRIG